jgi:hypothetical protein
MDKGDLGSFDEEVNVVFKPFFLFYEEKSSCLLSQARKGKRVEAKEIQIETDSMLMAQHESGSSSQVKPGELRLDLVSQLEHLMMSFLHRATP